MLADALRWGCVILLATIGVWFARTVGHFAKGSPRRPLLGALLALSLAAAFLTLVAVAQEPLIGAPRLLAAAALAIVAAFLFRSALRATRGKSLGLAFSRATPAGVVQSGPYRHVRHPLYTAYSIFWAACALLSGTYLVVLLVAGIILLYVAAARMEEADIMRSTLAPGYSLYRANTGMLIPNPFKARLER
jgi:protein-S-isoprenylcysteine O-methyltransferase Ste14